MTSLKYQNMISFLKRNGNHWFGNFSIIFLDQNWRKLDFWRENSKFLQVILEPYLPFANHKTVWIFARCFMTAHQFHFPKVKKVQRCQKVDRWSALKFHWYFAARKSVGMLPCLLVSFLGPVDCDRTKDRGIVSRESSLVIFRLRNLSFKNHFLTRSSVVS